MAALGIPTLVMGVLLNLPWMLVIGCFTLLAAFLLFHHAVPGLLHTSAHQLQIGTRTFTRKEIVRVHALQNELIVETTRPRRGTHRHTVHTREPPEDLAVLAADLRHQLMLGTSRPFQHLQAHGADLHSGDLRVPVRVWTRQDLFLLLLPLVGLPVFVWTGVAPYAGAAAVAGAALALWVSVRRRGFATLDHLGITPPDQGRIAWTNVRAVGLARTGIVVYPIHGQPVVIGIYSHREVYVDALSTLARPDEAPPPDEARRVRGMIEQ